MIICSSGEIPQFRGEKRYFSGRIKENENPSHWNFDEKTIDFNNPTDKRSLDPPYCIRTSPGAHTGKSTSYEFIHF